MWGHCGICNLTPASGITKTSRKCIVCFYRQWQINPGAMKSTGAPCMAPGCIATLQQIQANGEASRQALNQLDDLLPPASSAPAARPMHVAEAAPPPFAAPTNVPTTSWGQAVLQPRVSAEPAQAALPPIPASSPPVKAPPPPLPGTARIPTAEDRIAELEAKVDELSVQLAMLRHDLTRLGEMALV